MEASSVWLRPAGGSIKRQFLALHFAAPGGHIAAILCPSLWIVHSTGGWTSAAAIRDRGAIVLLVVLLPARFAISVRQLGCPR